MNKRTPVVLLAWLLGTSLAAMAEPRIDNVLVRMVPPGSTALIGAHMDQIKQTDLYRKMLAAQKVPELDHFAAGSGFDPRRDVREFLFAVTPRGEVLLARGTFNMNPAGMPETGRIRHGEYSIWSQGNGGFCILDATLAVAGQIAAIEAALDEWKSGTHTAAQPLLARVSLLDPQSQFWALSTGAQNVLGDRLPKLASGLDLSKIFSGLQDASFEADFSTGLRAGIRGSAASEKEALNLRDTVRGLVGLGR
jgi:hypothetical protein